MIEDHPLLRIRRKFPRPTSAQVEVFRGQQTGHVVDALGGSGGLDPKIKPIGGVKPFCGVAVTCNDGPADNLATYASLDVVQPGDVVISTAHGFDRIAVIGDLAPRHDEERRRRRLRHRRQRPRHRRHPRRRAPLLRGGRDAQFAGAARARHDRLCRSSAAARRSVPATSSSATRTAWWWCPSPGSRRRSRGWRRSRPPRPTSTPR